MKPNIKIFGETKYDSYFILKKLFNRLHIFQLKLAPTFHILY